MLCCRNLTSRLPDHEILLTLNWWILYSTSEHVTSTMPNNNFSICKNCDTLHWKKWDMETVNCNCLLKIIPWSWKPLWGARKQHEMLRTSASPSNTLTATSNWTLYLAANGVRIVNTEVMKIPIPKTHLPPNLVAANPPGICVIK